MNKKGRPTLTQEGKIVNNGIKGDYHIHTNYSDGVFSPEKIVDLALDAGLQAISLTDHDNVLSYNIALEYLKTKEVDAYWTMYVAGENEIKAFMQFADELVLVNDTDFDSTLTINKTLKIDGQGKYKFIASDEFTGDNLILISTDVKPQFSAFKVTIFVKELRSVLLIVVILLLRLSELVLSNLSSLKWLIKKEYPVLAPSVPFEQISNCLVSSFHLALALPCIMLLYIGFRSITFLYTTGVSIGVFKLIYPNSYSNKGYW